MVENGQWWAMHNGGQQNMVDKGQWWTMVDNTKC